ncbi:hypothetical protein Tco_1501071 [Tanacetum coccineum]
MDYSPPAVIMPTRYSIDKNSSYLDPAFMSIFKDPDERRQEQWEKTARAQNGFNFAKLLGFGDLEVDSTLFFVTSQEPYEGGVLFKGNLLGSAAVSYEKIDKRLHETFGDQYKFFLLINPEDEKPVAVVVPRKTLQPETTGFYLPLSDGIGIIVVASVFHASFLASGIVNPLVNWAWAGLLINAINSIPAGELDMVEEFLLHYEDETLCGIVATVIADNNMIVIYVKVHFLGGIYFEREPIGTTNDGNEVFFRDVWPSTKEIAKIELFSPEVKVVSIVEFLHGAINRTVGGITFQESDIEELKSNWQFTRLSLRWPESVESNV